MKPLFSCLRPMKMFRPKRAPHFFLAGQGLRRCVFAGILCSTAGWFISQAQAEDESFQVKFFEITEGQLSFTYTHGEDRDIYVLDFSTLEVHPLIVTPEREENAEFSPDGKHIAFNSEYKGSTQIFLANADGTNVTRLTSGASSNENPSWSPDGKQLVFHTIRDSSWDLVALTVEGGKQQVLLKNGHRNMLPRFSPRGNELLFSSNADWPGWDIFLLDLNTKKTSILTKGGGSFLSPTWNPFGQGFAFIQSEGQETGLWYGERGSTAAVRLNPPASGKYVDPCWSGKGDFLFVAHERTPGKSDYQLEVVRLKSDAGSITASGEFTAAFQAKASVRHPSFSPFPSIVALMKKLQRKQTPAGDAPGIHQGATPQPPP